jgi:uridine kinase
VEGIHAFCDERLRELFDLKAYVRVDSDVALLRRLKRDIRDRGRTLESVTEQYLSTVKPMFDEYVNAYARFADVIIPVGGKSKKIADMLEAYIRTIIDL